MSNEAEKPVEQQKRNARETQVRATYLLMKATRGIWGALTLATASLLSAENHLAEDLHDVVIYGGTSGAVTAAVQAAEMGNSVVLINPYDHLGGLTSSGLGQTDSGRRAVIGGLSREFYQRVRKYYRSGRALGARIAVSLSGASTPSARRRCPVGI